MEFKKYGKIHAFGKQENAEIFTNPNDEIVIQEKIDGGNFRFYFTEKGELILGSRTQQLTSNEGNDDNVKKAFKRVVDYVREQINKEPVLVSNDFFSRYIFYGEACFKHTITYDFAKMPPFIGYDIFDTKINAFLNWREAKVVFEDFNLSYVAVTKVCKASEMSQIDDMLVPTQQYALVSAPDKQAEGIVIKNYKLQIFAKYVRNIFKEKNAEAFGGNPKYNKVDDTNNAEFLFKYVTNARIEKLILKLIDEGHTLEMRMMGELIKRTYIDIIEEEWREIFLSNWKLDFKECRKLIAPRCRAVLASVITNNQFNYVDSST